MANKKVVRYIGTPVVRGIGKSAILTPVDHPDTDSVSNNKPVTTSAVVNYGALSGFIETQNTVYLPLHPEVDGFGENAK